MKRLIAIIALLGSLFVYQVEAKACHLQECECCECCEEECECEDCCGCCETGKCECGENCECPCCEGHCKPEDSLS